MAFLKEDDNYWEQVSKKATEIASDGCTGVVDFYLSCCQRHDIHYRLHVDLDGTPITREKADAMFRECIQQNSRLKKLSPMSWIRWAGVRLFGSKAWKHREKS